MRLFKPLFMIVLLLVWVTPVLAKSALDPSQRKPNGLEIPNEAKTLNTYVVPTEKSPKMPELMFRDHSGQEVKFSDLFDNKRPVVLHMIYLGCPRMCTEVLNGSMDCLKKLALTPGEDYRLVTVSFDPEEGGKKFSMAASKRSTYVEEFVRADIHGRGKLVDDAWTWLVDRHSGERGDKTDSYKLSRAIDFNFQFNEEKAMYEHPSMTVVLTPDGKISRYLYGINYQAKDMKLAIMEASKGNVGTSVEKLISWCYRYDPMSNGYTPDVLRLLSMAAAVSALLFGGFMFKFWRKEFRRGSIK